MRGEIENERLFGVCGRVVPAVGGGFGVEHLGVRGHRVAAPAASAAPDHQRSPTTNDDHATANDDLASANHELLSANHDHDPDATKLGLLEQRLDGACSSQGQAAHANDT